MLDQVNSGAPRSVLTGVPGWESEEEQHALKYLAERVPDNGCIVEIGSEFGMSTSIFAKFSKPFVHVSAVDPLPDEIFQQHYAEMTRIGVAGKVMYYRAKSEVAAQMYWENDGKPINLLFVDGDHTTDGVVMDITNWAFKVALGGLIVFHDTTAYTSKMHHEQHGWVQNAIDGWRDLDLRMPERNYFVEVAPVGSMRIFVRVRE